MALSKEYYRREVRPQVILTKDEEKSRRNAQIAHLAGMGWSRKEIAAATGYSYMTVWTILKESQMQKALQGL